MNKPSGEHGFWMFWSLKPFHANKLVILLDSQSNVELSWKELLHITYNFKHLWTLSFMLGVKAFNGLKNFGTSREHNYRLHSRRKIDGNQAKHSQRCGIGCCYSYCLQHGSPNKTVIQLYITAPSDLWSQQSQHIVWLPTINDQPDHDIPTPVRPWPSCPPAT